MSDQPPISPSPPEPELLTTRPVGGTEFSWCKAVPGGTGITVLALHLSKPPDIPLLQSALRSLQNSHPILRSKLRFNPTTNTFSFVTPTESHLQILSKPNPDNHDDSVDSFQLILEHEINQNSWCNPDPSIDAEVLYASVYSLNDALWVVALRLHTAASDRTAAAALLRKLLEVVGGGEREGAERGIGDDGKVNLGIEELIPSGKANKPFWARGVDLLGYSLNSFRLANIDFVDANSPRSSRVVRLQMNKIETKRLLDGCESRGIKLCAVLASAGMIAAHSSKTLPVQKRERYAVVTLIDCRSILDPGLSTNHFGFYHSAVVNTHDVGASEDLWELANRSYTAFTNARNWNKHFTDMGDLNFLMCKAIDNPALTPSSSLRTAFISVFEEPIFETSTEIHGVLGVEDYLGCSSVHGVGPTLAIFDTIRNGCLDCSCVYPSPLHSREQMQNLVREMKKILLDARDHMTSEMNEALH